MSQKRTHFGINKILARQRFFPVLALPLLLLGCETCDCVTPVELPVCADFEEFTPGTRFVFQDTFVSNGISFTVEAFQWGDGRWTNGNYAEISNQGWAVSSGNDLKVNNVNIRPDLAGLAVNQLSFSFGEYGGNLNLNVNGEHRNFSDYEDIISTTIGGTNVSVAINLFPDHPTNKFGVVTITGPVSSFSTGGQELWLDHLCLDSNE